MSLAEDAEVAEGLAMTDFSLAKTQRSQRIHVQMTNARSQSYAARATLLAGERKGILQAKFWEVGARCIMCVVSGFNRSANEARNPNSARIYAFPSGLLTG